ncbi:hypothetical protein ACFPRL_31725 [Pseudoclavibacter helvolus]
MLCHFSHTLARLSSFGIRWHTCRTSPASSRNLNQLTRVLSPSTVE